MNELLQGLGYAWTDGLPALQDALLWLLLSFVLAQPLAWVYTRTHSGMSYSRAFVQSLVLLSLVVTAVMLAVGDSMARAFGLFGALALIRFRTPVKDTRDATFLFLSVAIGICTGVQSLALSVLATGFALAVALYLHYARFGVRIQGDGMLRFRMPALAVQEAHLRQVLVHYCRTFALVRLAAGTSDEEMEFAYQLQLRDPATVSGLVADVQAIPGAVAVQVLMQSEHEEI